MQKLYCIFIIILDIFVFILNKLKSFKKKQKKTVAELAVKILFFIIFM